MAGFFAKLNDLNKNRIDWQIQVRCCRKWRVPQHGNFSESMELLLVDKDGTHIQASVKGYIIDRFDDLMTEGELYVIKQFSLVDRPKNFPVAVHPLKISFHKNTYVGPTVSNRFPKTVFSFRSFKDIKNGSSKDEAPLFDVIGNVVDFNDSRMKDDVALRGNKNVQLLLEDLEGEKLQCVLWDPYCHQVQNIVDKLKKKSGDPCVIIIQLCRTKNIRGEIGVSNTYHATKVVVNKNLEEIVEFTSKIPAKDSTPSFSGSQLSKSSVFSVTEELQSSSVNFMTLEQIKGFELVSKVWVVACISDVLFDKEWYYTSCMKCRKKVSEKDAKFFCKECGDYVVGNARFKIHVRVVDGKDNAVFLLWDDIARQMIGTSASELCERMVLESYAKDTGDGVHPLEHAKIEQPQQIEDLIRKEFLFKVSVESKHLENRDSVYVVDRFCDDVAIIKEHKLTDHKNPNGATRPYKDIVGDTNWESEHEDEETDPDAGFKSPDAVLGKRSVVSSAGGDPLFEGEGASSQLSISSKRKCVVKEEDECNE